MKIKDTWATPFLDMLFNLILGFICMFGIVLAALNTEESKTDKNSVSKAEFLITITWPSESNDDVDSYLQGPNGSVVYFSRKEDGLMHLEFDDLGYINDTLRTEFGEFKFAENRETTSIRASVPGQYIFNVHLYRKGGPEETPVEVVVEKMNPYRIILAKTVVLRKSGDEETICRFTLDADGNVTNVNFEPKMIRTF